MNAAGESGVGLAAQNALYNQCEGRCRRHAAEHHPDHPLDEACLHLGEESFHLGYVGFSRESVTGFFVGDGALFGCGHVSVLYTVMGSYLISVIATFSSLYMKS